jgi:hypothetical protein
MSGLSRIETVIGENETINNGKSIEWDKFRNYNYNNIPYNYYNLNTHIRKITPDPKANPVTYTLHNSSIVSSLTFVPKETNLGKLVKIERQFSETGEYDHNETEESIYTFQDMNDDTKHYYIRGDIKEKQKLIAHNPNDTEKQVKPTNGGKPKRTRRRNRKTPSKRHNKRKRTTRRG